MWHLIQSEWLRVRTPALTLAVAHLLILRLVGGVGLFQSSMPKLMVGTLVYALAGLLFGLAQMGAHKKLNRWTYLIHRPLAPRAIFGALAIAATGVLTVVVALPLLLVTLYLDFGTSALVDGRQYLMPVVVLGLALAFHWVGAYMALSHSRAAFLVGVVPFYFFTREVPGVELLLVQTAVVVWLGALVCSAFKPDRSVPPKRAGGLIVGALPLQLAFLAILSTVVGTATHTGVAAQRHGWRSLAAQNWSEHFADGTVEAASYVRGKEAIEHGLGADSPSGVETERVEHVRAQIQLAAVHDLETIGLAWPVRHQLMVADRVITLDDAERGVRWTFSHDHMLFRGQDARSGAFVGWMGTTGRLASDEGLEGTSGATPGGTPGGATRFSAVPRVLGNRDVITPRRLYEYDAVRERIVLRFETEAGERIASSLQVQRDVAFLLTDHRLYLFDPKDLAESTGIVEATGAAPLSDRLENLHSVQVAELLDSHVVSFLFGSLSERGFGAATQVVGEVPIDGGAWTAVATRSLRQGWPDFYRYRALILGPLPHLVDELIWSWINPFGMGRFPGTQRVEARLLWERSVPSPVWVWTLIVSLAAAAWTVWHVRRRGLDGRARWLWPAVVAVTGVVGYASFLCLTQAQRHPRESSSRVSVNAPLLPEPV